MIKIVTTVGTSLFTNYQKPETIDELGDSYTAISHEFDKLKKQASNSYEENKNKNSISAIKNRIKKHWFEIKGNPNENASAEIKSILKIVEESESTDVEVHLLATDSILSILACELIKDWFESHKEDIKIIFTRERYVIKDLKVDNKEEYKQGLSCLVNLLYDIFKNEIIGEYTQNCILNITGGYKGTVPYLTLFAQINKIQIKYIFEDTDVLLTIPALPIKLDEKLFDKHYKTLNKLEEPLNKVDYHELCNDLASCIELDGKYFLLNALGEILWKRYKSKFFIFYAPDDCWEEIQNQNDIKRILTTKFYKKEVRKEGKVEIKGDKYCYDDGNNNNRIYFIEKDNYLLIYKTFESEEKARAYIEKPVDFQKKLEDSKVRKMEIQIIK